MEINNDFRFLSDESKVSIAYAMQYAFSAKNIECWKVVLMRSDVNEEDLFEISEALASHNLLLSLYAKVGLPPKSIVGAFAKSYDDDQFWALAFELKSVTDYIEKLSEEDILSLYGHVKSGSFWKIVDDFNPKKDEDDENLVWGYVLNFSTDVD